MASSYFQGGDFVELLNAQGKAPAATWKLQGKILRSFDKAIKGNAFQMDGSSETKMQLPKTTTTAASSSLGITQRFLVLQLLVPFTRSFSLEIGFADFQKIRRRFVVASAFRETTRTALHVQIPLGTCVPRDQWLNLVFDLHAMAEQSFPGTAFRSMESLCISGSCRLKRVFTMKDAPTCVALQAKLAAAKPTTAMPGAFTEWYDIPKSFQFSVGTSLLPIPTDYFIGSEDALASVPAIPKPTTSNTDTDAAKGKKTTAGPAKRAGKPVRATTAAAPAPGARNTSKPEIQATKERGHSAPVSARGPKSASPPPQISRRSPPSTGRGTSRPPPATSRSPVVEPPTRVQREVTSRSNRSERLQSPVVNDREEEEDDDISAVARNGPDTHSSNSEGEDEQFEHSAGSPLDLETVLPTSHSVEGSTDRHSRRQQRRQVMAQIQSKLDELKREAEEEDARDRVLFLKHTRLSSTSASTDEPVDTSTPAVGYTDDDTYKELLRSPEPMLLRRVQPVQKPAISFSSSIFSFQNRTEPLTELTRSQPMEAAVQTNRRLFDWDSLLDESVGALTAQPIADTARDPIQDQPSQSTGETENQSARLLSRELERTSPMQMKLTPAQAQDPTPVPFKQCEALAPRTTRNGHAEVDVESSFDFSLSPIAKEAVAGATRAPAEKLRTQPRLVESPPHSNSVDDDDDDDADADDVLSLDLTDDLDAGAGSPQSIDADDKAELSPQRNDSMSESADDEDSFDFDDLVVHARSKHHEEPAPREAPRQPLRKSSDRSEPSARPPNRATTDREERRPPSSSSHRQPSSASPLRTCRTPRIVADSIGSLSSSTDRRLASLLESTDWSQLPVPLSSMVGTTSTRDIETKKTKPKPPSSPASACSIELVYDPILRCYFDPVANKYYALGTNK